MPYLQKADTRIYYEQRGSGPPLLLIAGMSSDSNSWQFIVDELSKKFELIMFDNRGCGRTEFSGAFSLHDLAVDATHLLDHLGYGIVHVAGHSMGGMIAQEMAINYPDRINRLILASSSPVLSKKAREIIDDLYDKWLNDHDVAEWFRLMFEWLFTPGAVSNKKFMDAAIIFALSYPYAQTLESFKVQVDAICSFDARKRIHEIMHRTLILSGTEDRLIPPGESKELMKIGGSATFRIIEGAAHSIHAEKPNEFALAIREFLTGDQKEPSVSINQ